MYNKAIVNIKPLGFTWETSDPFIFCVHHLDNYPKGNDQLGPDASLAGRYLGQDFTIKDGWRMYHGDTVPGFPAHPHRGFETVTVVQRGLVDHSDSHGAAGRYGNGDVQWMTAGAGLQHSEMFPLLNRSAENPLELFQIWLNLPRAKKFAPPHFAMLWAEDIPTIRLKDKHNRTTEIDLVTGSLNGVTPPSPAPDSWAANPANEVAIWVIRMEANAEWTLPAASPLAKRSIYFYKGSSLLVAGREVAPYNSVELLTDQEVILYSGTQTSYILLLQAIPIAEPVVQHGPFVMNTHAEIQQAITDYHSTQFGGWPWDRYDNVHGPNRGRFARFADGTEIQKGTSKN